MSEPTEPKKYIVTFPHVREFIGQNVMFEPGSEVHTLPDDDDTRQCVEKGWLKPFEPSPQNTLAPCPQWTKQIAEKGGHNEESVYHIFDGERLLARVRGEDNASTLIEAHNASLAPCPIKDEERMDWLEDGILQRYHTKHFYQIERGPMSDQITVKTFDGRSTKNHTADSIRKAIDVAMDLGKPEASTATTGTGPMTELELPEADGNAVRQPKQNELSELLDQIEQRANTVTGRTIGELLRERRLDVCALIKALRRAVWAITAMAGEHWYRSDISPGIELQQIEKLLREPADSVGRGTNEHLPTPVTPNSASPAHTIQEDFEHFLAYSGLISEPEETREKLFKAFEAAWEPASLTSASNLKYWHGEYGARLRYMADALSESEIWLLHVTATEIGETYEKANSTLQKVRSALQYKPASPASTQGATTDKERLDWLEQHPRKLEHCTWVNTIRGRIYSMGYEFDPLVGDCHKTLREAIDAAMSPALPPPLSKTSSSSVEKDARPANLERQEWTAKFVRDIIIRGHSGYQKLADLHNASLSARPATTEVKMEKDL